MQGANQGRCQGGSLIEHNLNDLLTWGIHDEKPTDMKHVSHHAQRAIVLQRRGCQKGSGPHDHIVRQAAQQHDHLWRFRALLSPLADPYALLCAKRRGRPVEESLHGSWWPGLSSQFTSSKLPPPASMRTRVRRRLALSRCKVVSAACISGRKALVS